MMELQSRSPPSSRGVNGSNANEGPQTKLPCPAKHRALKTEIRGRPFDRPAPDRFGDYVGSLFGYGMSSLARRDALPDIGALESVAVGMAQFNCLFDWAERTYPTLFAPPGATLQTLAPYVYRHYPATQTYLGRSSIDNHVYYLGPLSGHAILDVGALADWLATAGCR